MKVIVAWIFAGHCFLTAFLLVYYKIKSDIKSKLKVYRMSDYEWFCAKTPEQAMEIYKKYLVGCHGENTEDYKEMLEEAEAVLLTRKELKSHTFYDYKTKRTFKEELADRTEAGFFATTEY